MSEPMTENESDQLKLPSGGTITVGEAIDELAGITGKTRAEVTASRERITGKKISWMCRGRRNDQQ